MGPYCAGVAGGTGRTEQDGTDRVDAAPGRGGPFPPGATLILLSGGGSRRLGRDKATTHVGGRLLVERVLAQVPPDLPVVLVGPHVPELATRVTVAREDPPGSGPLAGIGAGLAHVRTPLVGVLAADMPFAIGLLSGALAALAATEPSATERGGGETGAGEDAVVPVDPVGHRQPLCAAYRTDALRAALVGLAPLEGRPVRAMLGALRVVEWPARAADLADVDTAEDLTTARDRAHEEGTAMELWLAAVREALGVEMEIDVDAVLDVARDAAHNVERPAAPLTTFLLGAAVARGADPAAAAATISRLAGEWASRDR